MKAAPPLLLLAGCTAGTWHQRRASAETIEIVRDGRETKTEVKMSDLGKEIRRGKVIPRVLPAHQPRRELPDRHPQREPVPAPAPKREPTKEPVE